MDETKPKSDPEPVRLRMLTKGDLEAIRRALSRPPGVRGPRGIVNARAKQGRRPKVRRPKG